MPERPLQTRAQSLRAAQTPADRSVWRILKAAPFDARHFRRQVPFGARYIADFASHRALLEAQGYRVIRFTNAEVLQWRLVERTLIAELGLD